MYYVNWVLTTAQLELLAADVSVVDYDHGNHKDKKHKKGEFDDSDADAGAVKRANEKWLDKYGSGDGAGWSSVSDILGKDIHTDVGLNLK